MDKCLHQLFEDRVEQRPDALAVIFENRQMTYSELNSKANYLANHLQLQGVVPDTLVGICVERSFDMIVGILGILKAGGAYVPIDPEYPEERIRFMIEDSGVSILLTQKKINKIPPLNNVNILLTDNIYSDYADHLDNPVSGVKPDNLAYVLYTSGSTGTPKGVLISHNAISGHCWNAVRYYQMIPDDRVLQFSSISFDGSVIQIFSAFTSGAAIILRGNSLWSIQELENNILKYGVTISELTPLYLSQWFKETKALPKHLRLVISAGDTLSVETAENFFRISGSSTRFLNEYGPTETTVTAAIFTITSDKMEIIRRKGNIPIGCPLPNRKIYILDPCGEPVPVGVSGELHIGGAGLARGYLNRPEVTSKNFILDPFANDSSSRLYKTGDMARYLPDGNIEFLGRIDDQAKIRGFRIETQEIESVLSKHPAVKENVVTVRKNDSGDKYLAAYITVNKGFRGRADDVRNFLKAKLPDYMIPSFFVFMDCLPVSGSGKIDRIALPKPNPARSQKEYAAARNTTEEVIESVWTDVLNIKPIGIHDSFFDLGGQSLHAVKLATELSKKLNLDITVSHIVLHPSIAELGEAVKHFSSKQKGIHSFDVPDLSGEAVLAPDIQVSVVLPVIEPRDIFLTGVTGFLGIFLLKEILLHTKAHVHCLIRSDSPGEGRKRIEKTADKYELHGIHDEPRIIPVTGNLNKPLLGLSTKLFNELTEKVEVIYHSGALVNLLYPYELLKTTNVSGTSEIIRLACECKGKAIHYISTVDVLGNCMTKKEDKLGYPCILNDGYSQSKWVAEKLVAEAGLQGLPVYIYRPSRICGSSKTGAWNPDDLASRFIKGCIQLGAVPEDRMSDNMIPVDIAASAIVNLSLRSSSFDRKIFHVANPSSVYFQTIADFIRKQGYHLERVPYQKWLEKLRSYSENGQNNALYSLLTFFGQEEKPFPEQDRIECSNFMEGLKGSGIDVPIIDEDILLKCFEYFERINFFEQNL